MEARSVGSTRVVAKPKAHTAAQKKKAAQLAAQKQQQLALHRQQLAAQGLVSPFDGTTPNMAALRAQGLTGAAAARPQLNATNQSALAPNGDINQSVTNTNHYTNRYYNIITSPMYGYGGGFYGAAPGFGGVGPWGPPGFVDPHTGVWYTRNEGGFVGWVKRLFRGY